MAWGKAGSTTLTVAGDNIEVTGMTENKFLVVLTHILPITNSVDYKWTVNNDTGSNYARRRNLDGGADGTDVNQSNIFPLGIGNGKPAFGVNYICNIATEEKLSIEFTVDQQTAGAGNAPRRGEHVAKWVNTSDSITTYDQTNVNSGDYDTDSNVSVIGSDLTPAAAITFPTNVQTGSRAEITDTRKMYNYVLNSNVTEITDGSYTVLKFTGDATFTPASSFNVEYLVVAGGGGSGAGYTTFSGRGGGGGGAGGYLTGTGHGVTPQDYNITVGAGGTANNNGSNSVFSSFTSIGGGRGGQIAGNNSAVGGSGGGGSGGDSGSAGTAGQGNAGGNGSGNGSGGAGGGGSGSAGTNGVVSAGGSGGAGTANSITGTSITYAAGGDGGNSDSSGAGTAGAANTGNGASGGSGDNGAAGAAGGSGIVILRFLTSGNSWSAHEWKEIGA